MRDERESLRHVLVAGIERHESCADELMTIVERATLDGPHPFGSALLVQARMHRVVAVKLRARLAMLEGQLID